jgi:hypothetical protein
VIEDIAARVARHPIRSFDTVMTDQLNVFVEVRGGNWHMHNEFTAIVELDGPWYVAYCAEVPGANGQGKTDYLATSNLMSLDAPNLWKSA